MKKKYIRIISTDSIGWLGNANQFINLYDDFFKNGIFDGVEVIAVKPLSRLKKIIHSLDKSGIKTVTLHGRTGGENQLPLIYNLTMFFVNKALVSAEELLNSFKKKCILFHTPYSEEKEVFETILKHRPKKLILENHRVGKQGIEDTVKQVIFYRNLGINVYGLIDIYHFIYGIPATYLKKNWNKLVDEIENFFLLKDEKGKKIFDSVHFPIGTRISDSLPIEEMTDDMLRYFAKKITPYLKCFTIENQVKNFGLVYSTRSMLEKTKTRNKINIDRLIKAGLL